MTAVPAIPPRKTPAPVQQHYVWLEDATSAAGRIELALKHGLAGVGAWRLGLEDPAVWPKLAEFRRAAGR